MEAEVYRPRAQWFSAGGSEMAEEEQGSRRDRTKLARDSTSSQSHGSLDKAAGSLLSGVFFDPVERATAEHLQQYSLV